MDYDVFVVATAINSLILVITGCLYVNIRILNKLNKEER